ncbi:hypothetical protein [Flavobacterium sp. 3HN19-14]|uniref:hypothetical protein n=1 Tax=Flavobacterium sp. 3HN19-14 TaxID=3448133 RepID=UPI003EDEE13C
MKRNYPFSLEAKLCNRFKYSVLFLVTMLITWFGNAQTTVTSNLINNNGSTTAVFTFRNANAYDVVITDLAAVAGSTATQTAELWYKTSTANPGVPGAISVVNGWTSVATATVATTGNLDNSVTQPMLSGMLLTVPANSYMRLAFTLSASLRYSTINSQSTTFTSGGCSIIVSANNGYAGTADNPSFTPRGFIGSLTFHQITLCPGTPTPGNTTGPTAACPGVNFTLGVQFPAAETGLSYSWQRADDINFTTNFETLSGGSYKLVTNQPSAKYYRARVSCSGNIAYSTPLYIPMDLFSNCYCTPTYETGIVGNGDQITNVTLETLNNSSGGVRHRSILSSAMLPFRI